MKSAILGSMGVLLLSAPAVAQDLLIAVAANFAAPAQEIAASFESETASQVRISLGATGLLYAQIAQGAPFDVFLAADQARPRQAVIAGFAAQDTQVTYALGRLAVYSVSLTPDPNMFKEVRIARVAIANPATAPFGAAALEVFAQLGIQPPYPFTVLRGANVGQAFQFAATGHAEVGFVSLSHAVDAKQGQHWIVPSDLHGPIAQDAIALRRSRYPEQAQAFLAFLSSPRATSIIEKYGYGLPANG